MCAYVNNGNVISLNNNKQEIALYSNGGVMKEIWTVGGIYFIWITLHFTATHLYSYICAHPTFLGFLSAPFVTSTPICSALRWTINTGADTITAMWGILGTWLMSKMIKK